MTEKGKTRQYEFFRCTQSCNSREGGVRRYLDKSDRNGTGSLVGHLKKRHAALYAGVESGQIVPNPLALQNPTLAAAFRKKGAKETYSNIPYTKAENK